MHIVKTCPWSLPSYFMVDFTFIFKETPLTWHHKTSSEDKQVPPQLSADKNSSISL